MKKKKKRISVAYIEFIYKLYLNLVPIYLNTPSELPT